MIVGNTTLLAISTLTSEVLPGVCVRFWQHFDTFPPQINFYTRLIKMRDQSTGLPMFVTMCIELACA
eukprot:3158224-Rhodomonas_salina.1